MCQPGAGPQPVNLPNGVAESVAHGQSDAKSNSGPDDAEPFPDCDDAVHAAAHHHAAHHHAAGPVAVAQPIAHAVAYAEPYAHSGADNQDVPGVSRVPGCSLHRGAAEHDPAQLPV